MISDASRFLLSAVVTSIHLIEVRHQFEALTDNKEEDNDHQDPVHARLLPRGVLGPWLCLGGPPGDQDEVGIEDGQADERGHLYQDQFHPKHVDHQVSWIL